MLGLVLRACVLLAAGIGAGFAINAVRTDGVALRTFEAPAACTAEDLGAGAVAAAPVDVLPPARASSMCDDPNALVIDVRPAGAFAEGHITNAVHLPCAASGQAAEDALGTLGDRHAIVVYGEATDDALTVAQELRRRVPEATVRVVALEGGFPAWSEAGLVCSSGPCDGCSDPAHEHATSADGATETDGAAETDGAKGENADDDADEGTTTAGDAP